MTIPGAEEARPLGHRPTLPRPCVCVVTAAGARSDRGHLDVGRAALDGGAHMVQLRAPELDDDSLVPLTEQLAARCRERGVLLIVDNRVGVAVSARADGVHLGQGDRPLTARDRLGTELLLGVSVEHPEQARSAEAAGADYLGVTVWATPTKPDARPVGLDGLRGVVSSTRLPVLAIGGITTARCHEVLAAGAAGVAVVSAVAAAPDPVGATRALVAAVHAAAPPVAEGLR
jgi:thiamine-phosphate pyrophosphorylase